MHLLIEGSGNATHLGRTEFEIVQCWTKAYPGLTPPDSYGQGSIIFYAANGDELWASYNGFADHQDDSDGTEILTLGVFTGGTGRFEVATGTFIWDGLFVREADIPPPGTVGPIEFGKGKVVVTGEIKY